MFVKENARSSNKITFVSKLPLYIWNTLEDRHLPERYLTIFQFHYLSTTAKVKGAKLEVNRFEFLFYAISTKLLSSTNIFLSKLTKYKTKPIMATTIPIYIKACP